MGRSVFDAPHPPPTLSDHERVIFLTAYAAACGYMRARPLIAAARAVLRSREFAHLDISTPDGVVLAEESEDAFYTRTGPRDDEGDLLHILRAGQRLFTKAF